MSFRGVESTLAQRPAAPPVDLDAGRLDIVRAALAGGFVILALLFGLAGAWIASVTSSSLLRLFGGALAGIALLFGGVVVWVSVREWLDHRARILDWHAVSIEAYERLQGAETVQKVTEWELSPDNPGHVLLAALLVHQRVMAGESTPYSVRSLQGPYFLAGRRVGNMNKLSAELMGRRLAQLGMIDGRREGAAGEWVPANADEIMAMIARGG